MNMAEMNKLQQPLSEKNYYHDSNTKLQILTHSNNYRRNVTRKIAILQLRTINGTPHSIRTSLEFLRKVRKDLLLLKCYNDEIFKRKMKFPHTKWLMMLLVRYVALEYEVYKIHGNSSGEREQDTKQRILSLVYEMLKHPRNMKLSAAKLRPIILRILTSAAQTQKVKSQFSVDLIKEYLSTQISLKEVQNMCNKPVLFSDIWFNAGLRPLVNLEDYGTDSENSDTDDGMLFEDSDNGSDDSLARAEEIVLGQSRRKIKPILKERLPSERNRSRPSNLKSMKPSSCHSPVMTKNNINNRNVASNNSTRANPIRDRSSNKQKEAPVVIEIIDSDEEEEVILNKFAGNDSKNTSLVTKEEHELLADNDSNSDVLCADSDLNKKLEDIECLKISDKENHKSIHSNDIHSNLKNIDGSSTYVIQPSNEMEKDTSLTAIVTAPLDNAFKSLTILKDTNELLRKSEVVQPIDTTAVLNPLNKNLSDTPKVSEIKQNMNETSGLKSIQNKFGTACEISSLSEDEQKIDKTSVERNLDDTCDTEKVVEVAHNLDMMSTQNKLGLADKILRESENAQKTDKTLPLNTIEKKLDEKQGVLEVEQNLNKLSGLKSTQNKFNPADKILRKSENVQKTDKTLLLNPIKKNLADTQGVLEVKQNLNNVEKSDVVEKLDKTLNLIEKNLDTPRTSVVEKSLDKTSGLKSTQHKFVPADKILTKSENAQKIDKTLPLNPIEKNLDDKQGVLEVEQKLNKMSGLKSTQNKFGDISRKSGNMQKIDKPLGLSPIGNNLDDICLTPRVSEVEEDFNKTSGLKSTQNKFNHTLEITSKSDVEKLDKTSALNSIEKDLDTPRVSVVEKSSDKTPDLKSKRNKFGTTRERFPPEQNRSRPNHSTRAKPVRDRFQNKKQAPVIVKITDSDENILNKITDDNSTNTSPVAKEKQELLADINSSSDVRCIDSQLNKSQQSLEDIERLKEDKKSSHPNDKQSNLKNIDGSSTCAIQSSNKIVKDKSLAPILAAPLLDNDLKPIIVSNDTNEKIRQSEVVKKMDNTSAFNPIENNLGDTPTVSEIDPILDETSGLKCTQNSSGTAGEISRISKKQKKSSTIRSNKIKPDKKTSPEEVKLKIDNVNPLDKQKLYPPENIEITEMSKPGEVDDTTQKHQTLNILNTSINESQHLEERQCSTNLINKVKKISSHVQCSTTLAPNKCTESIKMSTKGETILDDTSKAVSTLHIVPEKVSSAIKFENDCSRTILDKMESTSEINLKDTSIIEEIQNATNVLKNTTESTQISDKVDKGTKKSRNEKENSKTNESIQNLCINKVDIVGTSKKQNALVIKSLGQTENCDESETQKIDGDLIIGTSMKLDSEEKTENISCSDNEVIKNSDIEKKSDDLSNSINTVAHKVIQVPLNNASIGTNTNLESSNISDKDQFSSDKVANNRNKSFAVQIINKSNKSISIDIKSNSNVSSGVVDKFESNVQVPKTGLQNEEVPKHNTESVSDLESSTNNHEIKSVLTKSGVTSSIIDKNVEDCDETLLTENQNTLCELKETVAVLQNTKQIEKSPAIREKRSSNSNSYGNVRKSDNADKIVKSNKITYDNKINNDLAKNKNRGEKIMTTEIQDISKIAVPTHNDYGTSSNDGIIPKQTDMVQEDVVVDSENVISSIQDSTMQKVSNLSSATQEAVKLPSSIQEVEKMPSSKQDAVKCPSSTRAVKLSPIKEAVKLPSTIQEAVRLPTELITVVNECSKKNSCVIIDQGMQINETVSTEIDKAGHIENTQSNSPNGIIEDIKTNINSAIIDAIDDNNKSQNIDESLVNSGIQSDSSKENTIDTIEDLSFVQILDNVIQGNSETNQYDLKTLISTEKADSVKLPASDIPIVKHSSAIDVEDNLKAKSNLSIKEVTTALVLNSIASQNKSTDNAEANSNKTEIKKLINADKSCEKISATAQTSADTLKSTDKADLVKTSNKVKTDSIGLVQPVSETAILNTKIKLLVSDFASRVLDDYSTKVKSSKNDKNALVQQVSRQHDLESTIDERQLDSSSSSKKENDELQLKELENKSCKQEIFVNDDVCNIPLPVGPPTIIKDVAKESRTNTRNGPTKSNKNIRSEGNKNDKPVRNLEDEYEDISDEDLEKYEMSVPEVPAKIPIDTGNLELLRDTAVRELYNTRSRIRMGAGRSRKKESPRRGKRDVTPTSKRVTRSHSSRHRNDSYPSKTKYRNSNESNRKLNTPTKQPKKSYCDPVKSYCDRINSFEYSSDSGDGKLTIREEPKLDNSENAYADKPIKITIQVPKSDVIDTIREDVKKVCNVAIQPAAVPNIADVVSKSVVSQNVSELVENKSTNYRIDYILGEHQQNTSKDERGSVKTKAELKSFKSPQKTEVTTPVNSNSATPNTCELPYSVANLLRDKSPSKCHIKENKCASSNSIPIKTSVDGNIEGKSENMDIKFPAKHKLRRSSIATVIENLHMNTDTSKQSDTTTKDNILPAISMVGETVTTNISPVEIKKWDIEDIIGVQCSSLKHSDPPIAEKIEVATKNEINSKKCTEDVNTFNAPSLNRSISEINYPAEKIKSRRASDSYIQNLFDKKSDKAVVKRKLEAHENRTSILKPLYDKRARLIHENLLKDCDYTDPESLTNTIDKISIENKGNLSKSLLAMQKAGIYSNNQSTSIIANNANLYDPQNYNKYILGNQFDSTHLNPNKCTFMQTNKYVSNEELCISSRHSDAKLLSPTTMTARGVLSAEMITDTKCLSSENYKGLSHNAHSSLGDNKKTAAEKSKETLKPEITTKNVIGFESSAQGNITKKSTKKTTKPLGNVIATCNQKLKQENFNSKMQTDNYGSSKNNLLAEKLNTDEIAGRKTRLLTIRGVYPEIIDTTLRKTAKIEKRRHTLNDYRMGVNLKDTNIETAMTNAIVNNQVIFRDLTITSLEQPTMVLRKARKTRTISGPPLSSALLDVNDSNYEVNLTSEHTLLFVNKNADKADTAKKAVTPNNKKSTNKSDLIKQSSIQKKNRKKTDAVVSNTTVSPNKELLILKNNADISITETQDIAKDFSITPQNDLSIHIIENDNNDCVKKNVSSNITVVPQKEFSGSKNNTDKADIEKVVPDVANSIHKSDKIDLVKDDVLINVTVSGQKELSLCEKNTILVKQAVETDISLMPQKELSTHEPTMTDLERQEVLPKSTVTSQTPLSITDCSSAETDSLKAVDLTHVTRSSQKEISIHKNDTDVLKDANITDSLREEISSNENIVDSISLVKLAEQSTVRSQKELSTDQEKNGSAKQAVLTKIAVTPEKELQINKNKIDETNLSKIQQAVLKNPTGGTPATELLIHESNAVLTNITVLPQKELLIHTTNTHKFDLMKQDIGNISATTEKELTDNKNTVVPIEPKKQALKCIKSTQEEFSVCKSETDMPDLMEQAVLTKITSLPQNELLTHKTDEAVIIPEVVSTNVSPEKKSPVFKSTTDSTNLESQAVLTRIDVSSETKLAIDSTADTNDFKNEAVIKGIVSPRKVLTLKSNTPKSDLKPTVLTKSPKKKTDIISTNIVSPDKELSVNKSTTHKTYTGKQTNISVLAKKDIAVNSSSKDKIDVTKSNPVLPEDLTIPKHEISLVKNTIVPQNEFLNESNETYKGDIVVGTITDNEELIKISDAEIIIETAQIDIVADNLIISEESQTSDKTEETSSIISEESTVVEESSQESIKTAESVSENSIQSVSKTDSKATGGRKRKCKATEYEADIIKKMRKDPFLDLTDIKKISAIKQQNADLGRKRGLITQRHKSIHDIVQILRDTSKIEPVINKPTDVSAQKPRVSLSRKGTVKSIIPQRNVNLETLQTTPLLKSNDDTLSATTSNNTSYTKVIELPIKSPGVIVERIPQLDTILSPDDTLETDKLEESANIPIAADVLRQLIQSDALVAEVKSNICIPSELDIIPVSIGQENAINLSTSVNISMKAVNPKLVTSAADLCPSTVSYDHVTSTRETQQSSKPSYESIEVDETPLSEKVKENGSLEYNGTADQSCSIGGPFLSEPISVPLKSIRKEKMEGDRAALDDSTDANVIFPIYDQVLIDNNLAQGEARCSDNSPVDSEPDNHLGFGFIGNDLPDEVCMIAPYTSENMFVPRCKEERIEHDDSSINKFSCEETTDLSNVFISDGDNQGMDEFSRPPLMSVETMSKLVDNTLAQAQQVAMGKEEVITKETDPGQYGVPSSTDCTVKSANDFAIDSLNNMQHGSPSSTTCTVRSANDFAIDSLFKLQSNAESFPLANLGLADIEALTFSEDVAPTGGWLGQTVNTNNTEEKTIPTSMVINAEPVQASRITRKKSQTQEPAIPLLDNSLQNINKPNVIELPLTDRNILLPVLGKQDISELSDELPSVLLDNLISKNAIRKVPKETAKKTSKVTTKPLGKVNVVNIQKLKPDTSDDISGKIPGRSYFRTRVSAPKKKSSPVTSPVKQPEVTITTEKFSSRLTRSNSAKIQPDKDERLKTKVTRSTEKRKLEENRAASLLQKPNVKEVVEPPPKRKGGALSREELSNLFDNVRQMDVNKIPLKTSSSISSFSTVRPPTQKRLNIIDPEEVSSNFNNSAAQTTRVDTRPPPTIQRNSYVRRPPRLDQPLPRFRPMTEPGPHHPNPNYRGSTQPYHHRDRRDRRPTMHSNPHPQRDLFALSNIQMGNPRTHNKWGDNDISWLDSCAQLLPPPTVSFPAPSDNF